MNPAFFGSAAEFRRWLGKNHASASELWLGFHRKQSGKAVVTYPEALDEALCFGWIDGIRKRLDETRYTIRFTPRKPRSIWSRINLRRARALQRLGRMAAAGRKALAAHDPKRSGLYSFENSPRTLDAKSVKRFRSHPKAWSFFQAQPPGYRRTASWWVISARKPETRSRRLARLIDDSARGDRLDMLSPGKKPA